VCQTCGAKLEINIRKKSRSDVKESISGPASEPVPEESLEQLADRQDFETVDDNTSEVQKKMSEEPEEISADDLNREVSEDDIENKSEPEPDFSASDAPAPDPRRRAVLEQYRAEWKKRISEDERRRKESVQLSARRHKSEQRRHHFKNIMVLVAYIAAFSALAVFLLQK